MEQILYLRVSMKQDVVFESLDIVLVSTVVEAQHMNLYRGSQMHSRPCILGLHGEGDTTLQPSRTSNGGGISGVSSSALVYFPTTTKHSVAITSWW